MKRPRPAPIVENDTQSAKRFLVTHIRGRIEALDKKNRQGMKLREYHLNCGRLMELERLQSELESLIKQSITQEDDDDA